jgi:hypothetical protein
MAMVNVFGIRDSRVGSVAFHIDNLPCSRTGSNKLLRHKGSSHTSGVRRTRLAQELLCRAVISTEKQVRVLVMRLQWC